MINKQLIDYVRTQLESAISPEKIKADLISKGWSSTDIESAILEAGKQGGAAPDASSSVQSPAQAPQKYYEAMIPVEDQKESRGMTEGIISIVCAVVALVFFPPVFGAVGIILGVMSRKKGKKSLGLVGIILSSIFMVVGLAFGILVYLSKQQ